MVTVGAGICSQLALGAAVSRDNGEPSPLSDLQDTGVANGVV